MATVRQRYPRLFDGFDFSKTGERIRYISTVRQLISVRWLRNMRTHRPVVFVGGFVMLYIVISNSFPSTFPANLRLRLWPEQNTLDRRSRAFYRQINESTKTLEYGLFFLLDLDSTRYMPSRHHGGDLAVEQDFGFSNCHQVWTNGL